MTEYESKGYSSIGVEEPPGTGQRKEGIEVQKLTDRRSHLDQSIHPLQ